MMKRLFDCADEFLQNSSWKALLVGLQITERCKKGVRIAASAVFLLTYIPLMVKFLSLLPHSRQEA